MSGFPKQRVFPRGDWNKIEDWKVEDPYGCDPEVYQKIFADLRTRIESLAVRLRSKS
jgi:protein-tyrosine-phosphatase